MTTRIEALVPAVLPPRAFRRPLRRIFRRVEARLTRFRASSELNRFCAAGGGAPSPMLFRALTTAARAWGRSGGLFDPRIRATLEAFGYGAAMRFDAPRPELQAPPVGRSGPVASGPWLRVRWCARPHRGELARHDLGFIGTAGLDLGGIGKGLALRYAARVFRGVCRAVGGSTGGRRSRTFGPCGPGVAARPGFMIDAGGDIWTEGLGPDGGGWRIGVPDPREQSRPLAVLRVAGRAVCTSSRGRRAWLVGGQPAHHLIDPRTSRPADPGLFSVTVVGRDPAWTEVWSKSLFVAGAGGGPSLAEARGIAAVFCTPDGVPTVTSACRAYLEPAH